MTLLSEMHKLTLNLLDVFDARMSEVADIRSDAQLELANFRAGHQAAAAEQQRRLDEYTTGLHRQVADLRQAAAAHLQEMSSAHQEMTAEQQRELAEQMEALHKKVSDLRQATATFLGDLDAAHQAMANAQGQQLADGRARLGADTATFREELDDAHQTMTHEQQQRLNVYMDDLDHQVTSLRHAANAFLKDLDTSHQAMAHAQGQQLADGRARLGADTATFREELDDAHQAMADRQRESMAAARRGLASDVASARRGFQAEQGAVRADQRGARQVWQALAGLKQQRRTMKPASVQNTVVTKAAPAPEPGGARDDLKVIRGIGATMEQRLNQAGIHTFAQLAASTPEALRRALGAASRLAKVESWIAQAREKAG